MVPPEANPDWRSHLLERNSEIRRVVLESRRIAVLGIKLPDSYQPAYYVPQYMQHAGYEIVPVPVYYPDAREILGVPVARRLSEIEGAIDIVNVFRRPSDLPKHLEDIVAARPRVVWLQSGIRNSGFAESLAREGIDVVQDRCIMVEHQLAAPPRPGSRRPDRTQ